MKKLIYILLAGILLSGCASHPFVVAEKSSMKLVKNISENVKADIENGHSENEIIEKSKTIIAGMLRDPESAKFRNVRLVQYLDGAVVCGEVNGKNAFGGYAGYSDFVAGTSTGDIRREYFDKGLDVACKN